MKRFAVFIRIWLLVLVACAAAVAFAFKRIDLPVAVFFRGSARVLNPLGTAFGAAVILFLESAVTLTLILARLVRGHLSRFAEVLALACLASICAYGINSQVLKPFFGVANPAQALKGATHTFHFLKGSANSSFPSGHMVLAGAFAGVFMRLYRASVWPLAALLALAAALLLVGDWHFLSDLIAGTFVGVSAGILAGEGWAVHSMPPPAAGCAADSADILRRGK